MTWLPFTACALVGAFLTLAAVRLGAFDRWLLEDSDEGGQSCDLGFGLGSAVRHKSGVFAYGHVVQIDDEDMTARVSVLWTSASDGSRQLAYHWFSLFELERAMTVSELEQARRIVE